jgi:hypothetical protein
VKECLSIASGRPDRSRVRTSPGSPRSCHHPDMPLPYSLEDLSANWYAVSADSASAQRFATELRRETAPGHRLFGLTVVPIAFRRLEKEVVFWVPELGQWTWVHLTGRRSTIPLGPWRSSRIHGQGCFRCCATRTVASSTMRARKGRCVRPLRRATADRKLPSGPSVALARLEAAVSVSARPGDPERFQIRHLAALQAVANAFSMTSSASSSSGSGITSGGSSRSTLP